MSRLPEPRDLYEDRRADLVLEVVGVASVVDSGLAYVVYKVRGNDTLFAMDLGRWQEDMEVGDILPVSARA